MQRISVTAPGKAVIAGEYAVLDDAPAIVMAVDRRARVVIEPLDAGPHLVSAPGFADYERRFDASAGEFTWQDGQDAWPLLEHCWRAVSPDPAGALRIVMDTRAFRDHATGSKLGIGSSAALTVALAQALTELSAAGIPTADAAYAAHREFQAGRGSGIDVSASLAGGLLEYRMRGHGSTALGWPQDLDYAFMWSGKTADTRERIDRMRQRSNESSRTALCSAATETVTAWRSGSASEALAALDAYAVALAAFSIDHDLGVFDAGHEALSAKARAQGLVYKPCGAGGGDIGIVVGCDAIALGEFVADAAAAGFGRTDLAMDRVGTRTEKEDID